ncbi:MAG TPA: Crp/Fnr family transcriptional regulator [Burkholderiales bacterium]|nr:Crp/Fnr family transcriptional regulator [Burkholderiales bacterium]
MTRINRLGSNHLLSLLPRDDREHVLGRCEKLSMEVGRVLYEAGEPIAHVYFPLSGMISMVLGASDGATIEVGVVGNEGLLGASIALGSERSHVKALIQVAGEFLRMTAQDFRAEAKRSTALTGLAQRFAQSLMVQVSQSVMCNRLHSMEERICRWLLMAHDRAGVDEIGLTQQFISEMLGVRRPSVTVAAGILQKAGLIRYSRSKVTVLDRAGLEESACECYALVNRELEALMRR